MKTDNTKQLTILGIAGGPRKGSHNRGLLRAAQSLAPSTTFDGKPVALMGASAGLFGTTRAQHHLRQSFVFLNALPLVRPEIMIPTAQDKFDAQGDLVDSTTKKYVGEQLRALELWVTQLRRQSM